MGTDASRLATMAELAEMKFLECCIKEALRLYPSVPLIARHLKEDIKIGKELHCKNNSEINKYTLKTIF